jgi:hypothetical protein
MSKNWGKTPITNADKLFAAQTRYYVETADGPEERIDRRPQGKVERFVDPAGNILNLQIFGDGDSRRGETEIRMRAQYHKKGFVEFAKCPIRHGTRQHALRDFAKMPAELAGECRHDPKVMERRDGDLYAVKACPHIEWLVAHRKAESDKAFALRNAHVAAAEQARKQEQELKAAQAELLREQLAERKARKPVKAKDATE